MTKQEMIQAILDCTVFHGHEGTSGYRISTEQAEKIYALFLPEDKKDPENSGKNVLCEKCGTIIGYEDGDGNKALYAVIHYCSKSKPSDLQEMLDKISVGAMTNTDSLFYDDLKPLLQKIIDRLEDK